MLFVHFFHDRLRNPGSPSNDWRVPPGWRWSRQGYPDDGRDEAVGQVLAARNERRTVAPRAAMPCGSPGLCTVRRALSLSGKCSPLRENP